MFLIEPDAGFPFMTFSTYARPLLAWLIAMTLIGVAVGHQGNVDAAHTPELRLSKALATDLAQAPQLTSTDVLLSFSGMHQDAHRSQVVVDHRDADLPKRSIVEVPAIPVAILPAWLDLSGPSITSVHQESSLDTIHWSQSVIPESPPPQNAIQSS